MASNWPDFANDHCMSAGPKSVHYTVWRRALPSDEARELSGDCRCISNVERNALPSHGPHGELQPAGVIRIRAEKAIRNRATSFQ